MEPASRVEGEGTRPWRSRTVLVTGATGFIGRHLCRRLVGCGARVFGIARRPPDPEMPDGMIGLRFGDMADARFVHEAFREISPDLVYHLAGRVSGSRDLELVLPTFRSNLESALHVLTEGTDRGVERIVLAGSLEEPAGSDPAAVPASPYAASKWAAGAYARMFHALYGTPVVLARLFMVYGPGQLDPDKLIPYVIRSLLHDEPPAIGGGVRPVDWIYVEDVADGLVAMGETPLASGSRLDLGSGTLTTIRTVVEMIERLMNARGAAGFGTRPDRPMEQVRTADVQATAAALGWRPTVGLEDGLARTVAWYRDRAAVTEAG